MNMSCFRIYKTTSLLLMKSLTYKLPNESIVIPHGPLNSLSPLPFLPKQCIKHSLVSNIQIR